jgi:hypothetical protein
MSHGSSGQSAQPSAFTDAATRLRCVSVQPENAVSIGLGEVAEELLLYVAQARRGHRRRATRYDFQPLGDHEGQYVPNATHPAQGARRSAQTLRPGLSCVRPPT